MKKFHKLVSTAVVSAMVLAMAGCGTQDAGASESAASNESVASNESASAAEGTEAASEGASAGTFKIGGMGPLTGDNAVYGMAVNNAAQMAVDEINAAGGVNGYTFELKFQDDESDAEKAVKAFTDVVAEELVKGEKIQLVGFGNFEVVTREEREGRNPKTGEPMKIAASKTPKFKPGKALKDMVNQ